MHRLALLALCLLAVPLPAQFRGFWERRPSLALARQEVGAAALGGRVYVAGGLLASRAGTATVERYDPVAGRWSRIADMPRSLHHLGVAAVGGRVYALGGYVGSSFTPTAECHRWNPATNRWSRIADLPRARGAFVAVSLGGRIYAVGGVEAGIGVSRSLAAYDPATGRWRQRAPMPTAREHLAAAAIAGKLYVAGGRRAGRLFGQLERYDPAKDRWTTLAPMPTPRGGNGAGVLDGKLVVTGGEGRRIFPETEEYDPTTNRWRRLADMVVPLHGIAPVSLAGEIVVAGGGVRPGFGATAAAIALRRLPTGVDRYGLSTPACRGPILASVTGAPKAGAQAFAVVSSPNAPARTQGLCVLGARQDRGGRVLLGFRLHVGLQDPLVLVPARTGAGGEGRVALPLPAGAAGLRLFAQFVWANTPSCRGRGPLSASDALAVILQ